MVDFLEDEGDDCDGSDQEHIEPPEATRRSVTIEYRPRKSKQRSMTGRHVNSPCQNLCTGFDGCLPQHLSQPKQEPQEGYSLVIVLLCISLFFASLAVLNSDELTHYLF